LLINITIFWDITLRLLAISDRYFEIVFASVFRVAQKATLKVKVTTPSKTDYKPKGLCALENCTVSLAIKTDKITHRLSS
jgi:hypothetical protein